MKKIILLILCLIVQFGYACRCDQSEFSMQDIDNASLIVRGQVFDIFHDKSRRQKVVTFKVRKRYKGVSHKYVTLYTNDTTAACGIQLTIGEKWVLYSYEQSGRNRIGMCQPHLNYSRGKTEPKSSLQYKKKVYRKRLKAMRKMLKKSY